MDDTIIFRAMRDVCGTLSNAAVVDMKFAIGQSKAHDDKPIFDCMRKWDDDQGIDSFEFKIIKDACNAYFKGADLPKYGARQIGIDGLKIIKSFEGLELKAYKCPAGIWTIGYGSTGPHVKPGMVLTEAQADALLQDDLDRFEAAVEKTVSNATQRQFDAMVSLAFNIGIGAFNGSTVARKAKAGDHAGAAQAFAMWNKAGGKVLSGLTRRREAEANLYRKG